MWANSKNLQGLQNLAHSIGIPVSSSKNSLAVERNWMRLDINEKLDSDNQFFIRWWGVHEPPYDFEAHSGFGDLYNQYTVRDAWWKHKWGPLSLFLGRQIVTWGESIAFRVGDVINSQDFEWNFGFANLEQSRLPMWMIHPIVQLRTFIGHTAVPGDCWTASSLQAERVGSRWAVPPKSPRTCLSF